MNTNNLNIFNKPVGFFDSGVGGLSVYSVFKKILPNENTLYYGDLKNMPYGSKSKEELESFARKILNFYKQQDVKAVVIACNTSSATVYDTIKDDYEFKIYPIIQSCAKVIATMGITKIGVFATPATIRSNAYSYELKKYDENISVKSIECPLWTNFVENNAINSKECLADIENKINEIKLFNPEKIILGCTHYPYLMNHLTKFYPKNQYIDPAEIFVKFIKEDMESSGIINTSNVKGYEKFYVSANPDIFVNNAKLFYKLDKLPELV